MTSFFGKAVGEEGLQSPGWASAARPMLPPLAMIWSIRPEPGFRRGSNWQ